MRLNYIDNIDCLEGLKEIPDNSVDLIVTDPPYSINLKSSGAKNSKLNPWGDLCNTSVIFNTWLREADRVLKDSGAVWCFINWRGLPAVMKAGMDMGWQMESLLVWDKGGLGPGGPKALRPTYELVALFTKPDFKIPNRSLADVQKFPWASYKPTGHPAEKPLALIRWIIQASDKKDGAVILDPFMGSGTTACAAVLEGCHFIGFELDANWAANARKRVEEETRARAEAEIAAAAETAAAVEDDMDWLL